VIYDFDLNKGLSDHLQHWVYVLSTDNAASDLEYGEDDFGPAGLDGDERECSRRTGMVHSGRNLRRNLG